MLSRLKGIWKPDSAREVFVFNMGMQFFVMGGS